MSARWWITGQSLQVAQDQERVVVTLQAETRTLTEADWFALSTAWVERRRALRLTVDRPSAYALDYVREWNRAMSGTWA